MTKILFIGDWFGEAEERTGRSFTGYPGRLLRSVTAGHGADPNKECRYADVFPIRANIMGITGTKEEGKKHLKPLKQGRYLLEEFWPHVEALHRNIAQQRPNIIVALGAIAFWALSEGRSSFTRNRGTVVMTRLIGGSRYKMIATEHPRSVLADPSKRPIFYADLGKVVRERNSPDFTRPSRKLWIEPTLADLRLFEEKHLGPGTELSVDIETSHDQITCVGLAPNPNLALILPFFFVDPEKGGKPPKNSYWRTLAEEVEAVQWLGRVLRTYTSFGQNYSFDVLWLWSRLGITPRAGDDTMLMHHALYPEMQKGLGFLASLYTDEPSWKFMRTMAETNKLQDD